MEKTGKQAWFSEKTSVPNYRFKSVTSILSKMQEAGYVTPESLAHAFLSDKPDKQVNLDTIRERLRTDDRGGQRGKILLILHKLGITEGQDEWYEVAPEPTSSPVTSTTEQLSSSSTISSESKSAPSVSVNIPDMLHGCLGREEATAEVIEALCKDRPRPVLIFGGPGIGKTTLKKHVLLAPEVVSHFGEHRYWVEADQAYNAETLARLIADSIGLGALDLNPSLARATLVAQLREFAAPVAIGLDNIETPLGMAVQPKNASEPDKEKQEEQEKETKELLKALGEIPHVALLASFRGGLRNAAGTFWHGVEVKPLAEDPAIELFLEVSGPLDPRPTTADVSALVKQVDNVPLAVVLLASYAETAGSFAQLEREWQARSVALLEHGSGKDDSWKAALAFSLESPLLQANPLASRLVRLMGQLPDGIRKENAEEALAADDGAVTNARNLLLRLGLIQYKSDAEIVRWTMLHPIREFLRTVDIYAPDSEDWDRSTEKYLRLLDVHGPKLGKEREAIEALYPEIDNVGVALLKQLRENRNSPQLSARFRYYGNFIYWVVEKGDLRVLEEGAGQNSQKSGWFPGRIEMHCIYDLGTIYLSKSDLDLAQSYFKEALILFHKAGNKTGETDCIWRLGDVYLRKFELELAQARYRDALAIFRKAGNKEGEAHCIFKLGDVHLKKSELQLAQSRYEKSLTLFRKAGNKVGEADCIFRLGEVHLRRSELELAQLQNEEALSLYLKIGEKTGEANCIKGFGDVAAWRGDTAAAKEHFEKALKLCETVGHRENQAAVLLCLSYLPDSPQVQGGYRERARIILDKIFPPEQYTQFEAHIESMYRRPAVG